MKKYTKILIALIISLSFFLGTKNINAKEVVYTNDNGVELDRYEYAFFIKVYGSKFLQYLDEDTYNQYSDIDFETVEVQSQRYASGAQTRDDGTFFSSPVKGIVISKFCGILCRVVTTATWYSEPSVKSYDVMGIYLNGPTRLNTPATVAYSSIASSDASTTKYDPNGEGFGAVVQLPQGEDVVITQSFTYTGTGTINGTYQHAMSQSSLTLAQQFNISPIGFGGVLDFYGDAYDIYDDMTGVYITV